MRVFSDPYFTQWYLCSLKLKINSRLFPYNFEIDSQKRPLREIHHYTVHVFLDFSMTTVATIKAKIFESFLFFFVERPFFHWKVWKVLRNIFSKIANSKISLVPAIRNQSDFRKLWFYALYFSVKTQPIITRKGDKLIFKNSS